MTKNKKPAGEAGSDDTCSNTQFIRDYTTYEIIEQFRAAMRDAGIHYSGGIIADGRLHRFHIDGHKQGTLNGAYILHLDGRPAGWLMDYTTGLSQTWRMSGASDMYSSFKMRAEIDRARREREAETRQKYAAAAEKAVYIWSQSKPIAQQSDHPYLVNKGIQPFGARLYRDALVIPLYSYNESRKIVNLQFINKLGEKRFLSGGKKRGCFHVIGDRSQRILICEGLATALSLFEESGQRTVIAFDAGNLLSVAIKIKELAPNIEIIICGDNDLSGVGQEKAREAAISIGGLMFIPAVPGMDWNDFANRGRYRHD